MNRLKNGKQVLASRKTSSLLTPMMLEGYTLFIVTANAKVIVEQLALEVAGREDVFLDVRFQNGFQARCTDSVKMSKSNAVEELKQKPFVIKEGTEYRYVILYLLKLTLRMKVKFRIQVRVLCCHEHSYHCSMKSSPASDIS